MDLAQEGGEAAGEHREVGHGGELEQHGRSFAEHLREQGEDVRGAVLEQEDLAPGGVAARRIGIDQVRLRQLRLRRDGFAAHFDGAGAQAREIALRRRSQFLAPLEIHHLPRHLRERPAIHSQPSGQVEDDNPRPLVFKPPPLRGAPYGGGIADFVGQLRCFDFLREVSLTLRCGA